MSNLELVTTSVTLGSSQIGNWDSKLGMIEVTYLSDGISGNPELRIAWPDGCVVTVLYEETAQFYLQGSIKT